MFKQLVPLSATTHRALKLSPNQPFDFASKMVFIPLSQAEIAKAAREYVIVFPLQHGVPQALTGYEADKNVYVNAAGQWMARYIPAHIRRYPFILSEIQTSAEDRTLTGRQFGVQVDIEAPHLSDANDHPLFNEQGEPTATLQQIQKVLMALQQDFEKTQELVAELDALNLLTEAPIKLSLADGSPAKQLTGFRVVDQTVLASLPAEQLAGLRSTGALALVYAHLISLTNLQDGWIAKHAANTAPAQDEVDVEQLFGDLNDTLKFNF